MTTTTTRGGERCDMLAGAIATGVPMAEWRQRETERKIDRDKASSWWYRRRPCEYDVRPTRVVKDLVSQAIFYRIIKRNKCVRARFGLGFCTRVCILHPIRHTHTHMRHTCPSAQRLCCKDGALSHRGRERVRASATAL